MEAEPTDKKERIVFNLAKIIKANLDWFGNPFITRAWCTSIAFKLVKYLEEQGVNLDE